MKTNEYVLTFSSKKVQDFPKILSVLLEKLAVSESQLTDFRLICDKDRILILLPKEEKAFAFIAQIVKETDCFVLDYKQKESEASETIEKEEIAKTKKSITNDSLDEAANNGHETNEDISVVKDLVIEETEAITSNDTNYGQMVVPDEYVETSDKKEIESNAILDMKNAKKKQAKTRAPRNPVYGVVMDYIISKDEVSFNEIVDKFPNEKHSTLNSIVVKAKKNGNIVSTGKGKYKVIK